MGNSLLHSIGRLKEEKPLLLIMVLALIFRLIAAIFAKGWGMLDDHFIVIESAQSWVDGYDYNSWLPGSPDNHGPAGINFFYPGVHFVLFTFFRWIGLEDPQTKMFVIRLIHGLFSLVTVYLGYRITETLDGKKTAFVAGLLLALYWFIPFMSVRNLVEMANVPFMMMGYWLMLREKSKQKVFLSFLMAGIWFGFAFNIRPQTGLITLVAGVILLFRRQWLAVAAMTLGTLLIITLIQGGIDYFIWGYPFAEIIGYINICLTERNDYITQPWYNYLLVLSGMLIPPVSLFLLFGFLRTWKKYLIIFLPVAIFLIFHSWFPNKQERFILPIIPFFIITGVIGWNNFTGLSQFWKKRPRLLNGCWIFFWILNTILLIAFSFTYSKKARVETMVYLSKYPDVTCYMTLDAGSSPELMPRFYINQWPKSLNDGTDNQFPDTLLARALRLPEEKWPRFILFSGDKDIQPMIDKARIAFPGLVYETTIEPGNMDKFIHWLNPINKNRQVIIYRNRAFFPEGR